MTSWRGRCLFANPAGAVVRTGLENDRKAIGGIAPHRSRDRAMRTGRLPGG
jgi:hypothetical protein